MQMTSGTFFPCIFSPEMIGGIFCYCLRTDECLATDVMKL